MAAPWLIFLVLNYTGWFGLAPWRWVFFVSGTLGLLWTVWWVCDYRPMNGTATLTPSGKIISTQESGMNPARRFRSRELLSHREVWAVVGAKFLSDAAWYFYMFWLPKFLMETFQIKFNAATSVGWIPYAASGVGCLVGGGFSSWLLRAALR